MVSRVLLGPGQHWVFPWERLEGFSGDVCRLSEPLKRRPGTAARCIVRAHIQAPLRGLVSSAAYVLLWRFVFRSLSLQLCCFF